MAQHDYSLANQTGLEFRADLNNALQAIVTQNSGETEPSTTFPGMVWRDTSSSPSVLKKRNDANSGWVTVLTAAGEAVSGAASASDQRYALGLGTAATGNVGTAAYNIVQLDSSARLPAVDGSQLLNLPSTGLAAARTSEAQEGTSNTVAITPIRLREGLNATGSAPVYACRAWVNFNGTGTVAIRASGNVSSITDNGTGQYTLNFTTAMPDANYSRIVTTSSDGYNTSSFSDNGTLTYTTTAMQILLTGINGATNANFDASRVSVAIFR